MDPIVKELLTCISWIYFIPELMGAKVDLEIGCIKPFQEDSGFGPFRRKNTKAQTLEMPFFPVLYHFPTLRYEK